MGEEELERVLDRRSRRVEGRALLLPVEVLPQRLRLRRQPERLAVAVSVVEVAEEAVGLDRARADQVDDGTLRLPFPEPREAGGKSCISGRRSATTTTRGASSA